MIHRTQKGKRVNLLNRVLKIQEAYKLHKVHEGVTDIWIYREKIYPEFFISLKTFHTYMKMNARKELREINNSEQ